MGKSLRMFVRDYSSRRFRIFHRAGLLAAEQKFATDTASSSDARARRSRTAAQWRGFRMQTEAGQIASKAFRRDAGRL